MTNQTQPVSIDKYLTKVAGKLHDVFPTEKWTDRLNWIAAHVDQITDRAAAENLMTALRGIANTADAFAAQLEMQLDNRKPAPHVRNGVDGITVIAHDGDGYIISRGGQMLAGPFATDAEAWSWLDKHSDEGLDDQDRQHRIATAFGG